MSEGNMSFQKIEGELNASEDQRRTSKVEKSSVSTQRVNLAE